MRNVLKAETLERRFPLLSVENGCIVSKDADLTVAFEVELPELYTVTAEEYETMHSTWIKAARAYDKRGSRKTQSKCRRIKSSYRTDRALRAGNKLKT